MLIIENKIEIPDCHPCANACRGGKCTFNTLDGAGLHKGEDSWVCPGEPQGAPGPEWPLALERRGAAPLLCQARSVWIFRHPQKEDLEECS